MTKQSAGDRSVVVHAGGAVNVTSGLSLSETQELFRMMLRESLAGIQDEAYQIAEARNEKLMGDFLTEAEKRFGAEVEQKLSGFRDPGAQFALRFAQTEYCKYGADEAEADAIELLMSRLDEAVLVDEKIVIDEAIKLCGRLSKRQIDLCCFMFIVYKIAYGRIGTEKQIADLVRRAATYIDGWNCSATELALLSHAGALQQFTNTKHWKPLSQVVRAHYAGLFLSGEAAEYFLVPEHLWPETLAAHVRNAELFQPNHVHLNSWESLLVSKGLTVEAAAASRVKAEENALTDDKVFDLIVQYAPEFAPLRERMEGTKDEVLHYDLAPIGSAIALARTRRDGWRPDLKLASIL